MILNTKKQYKSNKQNVEIGFEMSKKIAEDEGYLSHISLEYIGECNWKELKIKLIKEIKQILLE